MSSRSPFWRDQIDPNAKASSESRSRIGERIFANCRLFLIKPTDQELMSVVRAIMEVTRFGLAEAEYRMWEAQHHGRSLVLATHFELAELFVERFAKRGLAVVIERECRQ